MENTAMTDRQKLEYIAKKGALFLEQCRQDGADPMDNLYRLVRLIEHMVEEKAP
jgi:hypothetical protein